MLFLSLLLLGSPLFFHLFVYSSLFHHHYHCHDHTLLLVFLTYSSFLLSSSSSSSFSFSPSSFLVLLDGSVARCPKRQREIRGSLPVIADRVMHGDFSFRAHHFGRVFTIRRMRFTTQWWAAFRVKSFKAAVIKHFCVCDSILLSNHRCCHSPSSRMLVHAGCVFVASIHASIGHERQDLLSPCDGMHACTD